MREGMGFTRYLYFIIVCLFVNVLGVRKGLAALPYRSQTSVCVTACASLPGMVSVVDRLTWRSGKAHPRLCCKACTVPEASAARRAPCLRICSPSHIAWLLPGATGRPHCQAASWALVWGDGCSMMHHATTTHIHKPYSTSIAVANTAAARHDHLHEPAWPQRHPWHAA